MSASGQDGSARGRRLLVRARKRLRDAAGQTSLEYGGLLILIAALIGTAQRA